MKVCIVSDSHDRGPMLAAAVEERIAALDGDPSPGATASLRALGKARALLARDATTILKEAKVAGSVAKVLAASSRHVKQSPRTRHASSVPRVSSLNMRK